MNGYAKICWALLGLVLLWGGCSGGPQDSVVLVIIDTARRDAFGCYGNSLHPTPNIDAVAADGVRFEQAISPSGWTLPAVASLFTGTWPSIHGGLGRAVTLTQIREEIPTAAEVFKGAGLTTLGFANAAFVSPMLHLDRGFDVFDHRYTYNWDARRADETIDVALEHIRKNRSTSNFVMIHLFDPHLDYSPPPDYAFKYTRGRTLPALPLTLEACLQMCTQNGEAPPRPEDIGYVAAVYQAEINFVDAQVGRLVQELKSSGMYDRTTLIITADHGEEFWDHGGFEHGHTMYDELVRVPLIIKFPASVTPVRRVVNAQVRLLDVMPTAFDVLGIEKPATFLGESLLPYALGRTDKSLDAFCESTLYGPQLIALRTEKYKYVHRFGEDGGTGELYDWHNDPAERNNLAGELPDVTLGMRTAVLGLHGELQKKSAAMSKPVVVDMSPQRIKQLRSLGYIR